MVGWANVDGVDADVFDKMKIESRVCNIDSRK